MMWFLPLALGSSFLTQAFLMADENYNPFYDQDGKSFGQSTARARMMNLAISLIGKPYVWGATGPDAFDCSGFVHFVLSSVAVEDHYPPGEVRARTYERILSEAGARIVNSQQAAIGDIVFFPANLSLGYPYDHIGIISDPSRGIFIGAQDRKLGVAKRSYAPGQYWGTHEPEIYRNIWVP